MTTLPPDLAQRMAIAATRWDNPVTVVTASGETTCRVSDLHASAARLAAGLHERGVGPGDVVALMSVTSHDLLAAIDATWTIGAAVTVLPIHHRVRDADVLARRAKAQAASVGARLVLVDDLFHTLLAPIDDGPPVAAFHEVAVQDDSRSSFPQFDADRIAVVQFTSGTSGTPRAVRVTHRQLARNHDAIQQAAGLHRGEAVSVSWLPLYHDMGLIGFATLPLTGARHTVLASPDVFMKAPSSWMSLVSRFGGTVTGGPSFAYAVARRTVRHAGIDLRSLRVAFNGGEPIEVEAMEAFVDEAVGAGMARDAMMPVYGMAEATLMVTCPRPGEGGSVDEVDADRVAVDHRAVPPAPDQRRRRYARLGPPVESVRLRIVDLAGGQALPERHVGEIEIAGESVVDEYVGDGVGTDRFRDGWFRTGDRGYLAGGGLVVCGRSKDVIIVAGRNIEPEEIERACQLLDGVRAGNVIAFGCEGRGREEIVVVAEAAAPGPNLVASVNDAVRSVAGVTARDVVFVAPGSLPKTSSGKLRRSACRTAYLGQELAYAGGRS